MLEKLINNPDVLLEINKDLKKFSTMRLDARGDLITVKSKEGLKFVTKTLTENGIQYRVLGWGANLLLPPTSSSPYIQIDFKFDREILNSPQKEYILPASVSLAALTSHANKFGLKGWEVFTGIPASLGGAIFMNAGTNLGEIGKIIKEVKLITKNGEEKSVIINDKSFSYRHNHFVNDGDVIYEARLFHFGLDEAISKKIKEYSRDENENSTIKRMDLWLCV
jgi:UDP-N-acetylmuramate dehydrogenase